MTAAAESRARRREYVFPEPGDTLTSIAERVRPADSGAARELLSWNLHLVNRRSITGTPSAGGDPGPLLCTDIVYIEPPLP